MRVFCKKSAFDGKNDKKIIKKSKKTLAFLKNVWYNDCRLKYGISSATHFSAGASLKEVAKMAKCCICSKGVVFGQNVSHSHRKTNRTWKPNIRKVKLEGSKAIYVCSRCLRTMKKA